METRPRGTTDATGAQVPEIAAALRARGAWDVEQAARFVATALGRTPEGIKVITLTGARFAAPNPPRPRPHRSYVDTTLEILEDLRAGIPLIDQPIIGPSS